MQLFEIPPTIPTPIALAIGGIGLAAGLIWMRVAVRDKAAQARRWMQLSVQYGTRGDSAYAKIRALDTPTMQVPIVELQRAVETPAEAARRRVAELYERTREAISPAPGPRDWAEGEMTAAFNRIVESNDWERGDTTTLPTKASPWVSPVPAPGTPVPSAPPAVVMAPRGPQTPPRWETRPAPDVPSRARMRHSEQPGLTGRMRVWGGSLLGPVPALALPAFPRPFQMPAQRVKPDPRLLAHLPADPTRQFRTRTVQA